MDHINCCLSLSEADIPEDRLVYAEVMYDVFLLNKKNKKKPCDFSVHVHADAIFEPGTTVMLKKCYCR